MFVTDDFLMICFCAFLFITLLYRAKWQKINMNFFDQSNTQAMRGLWCFVIALVHIPQLYSNRIQDMIGSFAYIGVTFFFMTSAYGLMFSDYNDHYYKVNFWKKRLPRLLFVPWIINSIYKIINLLFFGDKFSIWDLVYVDSWVKWLIGCYFLFWISNLLIKRKWIRIIAISFCIIIGSIVMYMMQKNHDAVTTIWSVECYGFLWGMILSSIRRDFLNYFTKKWLIKWNLFAVFSLFIGISYLRWKYVPFAGDYVLKIILGLSITLFILIINVRIQFGNRINISLGKVSFEIYILHGYVYSFLERIHTWNSSACFILIGITITVINAYIINYVINTILRKIKTVVINSNDGC